MKFPISDWRFAIEDKRRSKCTNAHPQSQIRTAMIFASCKIGAASAADGFVDAVILEQLLRSQHPLD